MKHAEDDMKGCNCLECDGFEYRPEYGAHFCRYRGICLEPEWNEKTKRLEKKE